MAELNCPEVEQHPSIGFGLDMLSLIFEENNYFHDILFESLVLSYSSDIIIQIDNITVFLRRSVTMLRALYGCGFPLPVI
jgi:hypothetical protein